MPQWLKTHKLMKFWDCEKIGDIRKSVSPRDIEGTLQYEDE